jgi:drug/metabolite transporter (DMT)-like permease
MDQSMKVMTGFVVMICCTVAANIFMKLGAMSPTEERFFGLVDLRTVVGLASFGAGGIIYAWILTLLPLNVAQSFAAAQFVAVIFASAVFLSEPIPAQRWLGILLIFIGILVVSTTGIISEGK